MLRYTILRFLIFGLCLALVWVIWRPSSGDVPLAVALAAVLSLPVSLVALRGERARASEVVARKVEAHKNATAAKAQPAASKVDQDASAEDAEIGGDDFR